MNEVAGVLWLVGGLGGLAGAAGLVACCLRLRSPIEFLLATYVLAWTGVVALALALSPVSLVTRGWLVCAVGALLVAAYATWRTAGHPRPPPFGSAAFWRVFREPAIAVLAVAVALGGLYTVALAFLTPVNEADALAYHLARVGFWKQEHALGYVANAVDLRLDVSPPNAQIGQLTTVLLSGSDRYVALPQLAAYAALVLSVAGLGLRAGLSDAEATFGALAFATLPVVVVQASGALNDLVVASFLAIATLFALRPGRTSLLLFALAIGLAIGTKFTALLALPALAVVVLVGRRPRHWAALLAAGVGGLALGSTWYVVNLAKTGALDGGLGETAEQRVELTAAGVLVEGMRLTLDLIDVSGTPRPHSVLYIGAASVLLVVGAWSARRSFRRALAFAGAAVLTAAVLFTPSLEAEARDFVFRGWAAVGRPETAPFELGWGLNDRADPVLSWYGPLGALLLCAGTGTALVLWRSRRLGPTVVGLALAPWIMLLTLSLTVVWDPFRGRFLLFGVAVAAGTWGVFARWPIAAASTAAIGVTSLALSLANYEGKPSGLSDIWPRDDEPFAPVDTIWNDTRARAQTRLRLDRGEKAVVAYVEENVPADASLALAPRENDFLSPYFGPRVSRQLALVSRNGGGVPADAEWLVLTPSARVRRCAPAWRRLLRLDSGWRIERRVSADACAQAPP